MHRETCQRAIYIVEWAADPAIINMAVSGAALKRDIGPMRGSTLKNDMRERSAGAGLIAPSVAHSTLCRQFPYAV